MHEKIMLRKRSVIYTVNDELKNICQIEHSRHRKLFYKNSKTFLQTSSQV
jgi:hypothetical protein